MHARGVMLIGAFEGVEPVTKRTGEAVPGLHRVKVRVSPDGGVEPVYRDASFNAADRDTGEPSAFAAALAADRPALGDEIAIKCRVTSSAGSTFANLNAVAFCSTADLDLRA